MRLRFATSIVAFFVMLAACTHSAWSAPIITSTVTDLGDGLFAYDLTLDGQDGEFRSFFAHDIAFTGNLAGFASAADQSDPTASFVYAPWTSNAFGVPVQSPGSYTFSAGTGGGSQYLSLPLARVVVAGDLAISGTIARYGFNYLLAGSFSSSNPSSFIETILAQPFVYVPPPENPPLSPPEAPADTPPESPPDAQEPAANPGPDPIQTTPPPLVGYVPQGPGLSLTTFETPNAEISTRLLVPEPGTYVLAAIGLATLAIFGRLGRRRSTRA